MKRKNSLVLDKKDKNLLYNLDLNGRLTYSQLSKRVRISKQLVKYRLNRLENEGFIKGYYTMIDNSKLGFITFRVYFKFRNLIPENKKKMLNYFKTQKQIWAVVLVSGKWDLAMAISVRDIQEFHNIWERILKDCLENIGEYQISIYSPIYHYSKSYILGEEDSSKIRVLGEGGNVKFDEKDLEILSCLSKDARMPILEISKKVNISPERISYRIKQLEKKKIIQGYRAMIDVNKLGYEFYKAEIRLSNYDKIDLILEFCHKNPNIYQVDKTIGGETLEIEFHVKSLKDMLNIIEKFEKRFPKMIERFDYITVLSEEKTTYMPKIN